MASQAWLESEHKRLTEENLELKRQVTSGSAVSPAAQDDSPPTLPQAVVEELERLRGSLAEVVKERDHLLVSNERNVQQLVAFGTQKRIVEDGVAKIIAVCVSAERQEEAKQMLTAVFMDADSAG